MSNFDYVWDYFCTEIHPYAIILCGNGKNKLIDTYKKLDDAINAFDKFKLNPASLLNNDDTDGKYEIMIQSVVDMKLPGCNEFRLCFFPLKNM